MPDTLTPRRRAFIEAFLGPGNLNATKSARLAGYSWPGKQGPRLLTVGPIASAIEEGMQAVRVGMGGPLVHVGIG